MNAPTVIWSMIAAACLTLGVVHGLVWWNRREGVAHGFFALFAAGAAVYAMGELALMLATTPAEFNVIGRWIHVPGWVFIVSLVWFVRAYLQAGPLWLAWTICVLRTLALALNFLSEWNLNFREVTRLREVPFLGAVVSVPEGVPNPLMLVAQLSLVLLLVFVGCASWTAWRRGTRRAAAVVGGAVVFFLLCGSVESALVLWGALHWPVAVSPFCLGLILAMSVELSRELLHASRLSADLLESEQRLTMAAEGILLGFWARDFGTSEVWASDGWRRLYQFPVLERLDMTTILTRVHEEDREAVDRAIEAAIEGDGDYEMEYRLALPDGTHRWIASRGRVEFDTAHRPVIVRGVSFDITRQKNAEREARQNRDELMHLSRVAMLGELSGAIAHELNQPLTAILSNAQAAKRLLTRPEVDRAEIQQIVSDIVMADQRAGEVIRSLRQLLRKGEVQFVLLDANEIIREILQLIRGDLLTRQVRVETDLAADLALVHADRVQLQQVLLNLVINAAEAVGMEEGGGLVVTVGTERTAGRDVRISVRDNGRGIPPSIRERMFEPFFTTKHQGLGLGLGICRSILSAHQSELFADNHPEGGAIFSFVLSGQTGGFSA